MGYLHSRLASQIKSVRVYSYEPINFNYGKISIQESQNTILAKKDLLDEMIKCYKNMRLIKPFKILVDELTNQAPVPIVFKFRTPHQGSYKRKSLETVLQGYDDSYIRDDGNVFTVFAPKPITDQMDSKRMCWIEPSLSVFNSVSQEPWR